MSERTQTTDEVNVKKLLNHIETSLKDALNGNIFETPPIKPPPFYVYGIGNTVISMWHIGEGVYDVTITKSVTNGN